MDRIWFTFYPARVSHAPAVVIAHSLAEGRLSFIHRQLHRLAAYLAGSGISAAVMELPYHMRRLPRRVSNLRLYTGSDERALRAYDQAASDVSTVAKWLRTAPGIDSERIGVVGLSLGAIVAHLAMGRDSTLSVGVAILGGGDVLDLRKSSLLARLMHPHPPPLTQLLEEEAALIEPLSYAHMNRPRRVLMIQGARDLLMPPHNSIELWKALGTPPIRWLDTGHFGLLFGIRSVGSAAADYLLSVWGGAAPGEERIPQTQAATVKLGLLSGLDSALTPALQWQAISVGRRPDHASLLHLDVGISGRGPFAGAAVTVNPSLDIGYARRFNGRQFRLYSSLHVVF